jgi:MFS superfamily sulfate permease-like transporter
MTGFGASRPLPSVPTKGPLTEPVAGARPRGWGPPFWPHSRPSRRRKQANRLRGKLTHDIVAGIVLTTTFGPVGIAYAVASGVPGIYGLYATIVPLLAYALFGPSRILVLGPDSSLAAVILGVVGPLSGGDIGSADDFSLPPSSGCPGPECPRRLLAAPRVATTGINHPAINASKCARNVAASGRSTGVIFITCLATTSSQYDSA